MDQDSDDQNIESKTTVARFLGESDDGASASSWAGPVSIPNSTAIYKLYKEKEPKSGLPTSSSASESREPPVLFRAEVYDANSENAYKRQAPVAVYYDDSPIKITINDKRTNPFLKTGVKVTDDEKEQGLRPMGWTGSIFMVSSETFAHFPLEVVDEDTTQAKRGRPTLKTDNLDSLSFTNVIGRSIDILSPYLSQKLKDIAGYYPLLYESLDIAHHVNEPWYVLLHQYPKFVAFSREAPSPGSTPERGTTKISEDYLSLQKEHVGHLCDFIKGQFEATVLPCLKNLQKPSPSIEFDMLWYVFEPGTNVYIQAGSSYQACVVMKVVESYEGVSSSSTPYSPQRRLKGWLFTLWYLESDGKTIGRKSIIVPIHAYEGVRELTTLPVCPTAV